jgi:hypothetical protein
VYTIDVRTDLDLGTIQPTTLPSLLDDVQTLSPEKGTEEQGVAHRMMNLTQKMNNNLEILYFVTS